MRWTIVGLVIVGIIAATAAAVLVVSLQAGPKGGKTQQDLAMQEIEILVAKRDMPAMATVDALSVDTKKIRRGEAPMNYLTDDVQAVGQILTKPVIAGEAFTRGNFAAAEDNVQMSRVLTEGQRAMSVMLNDETGIEQLLYPGCLVDVIGSFRVMKDEDGGDSGEIVSATLLQSIPVLAVGPRTVVTSSEGAKPQSGPGGDTTGRRARVIALNVTTKQSELLQLASKYGSISVVLRNPLDTIIEQVDGTRLRELFKNMPELLADLAATTSVGAEPLTLQNIATASQGKNGEGATTQAGSSTSTGPKERRPLFWTTTVIRGTKIDTQKFQVGQEPVEN
jgi:Flp pilus assembly protein CpaB